MKNWSERLIYLIISLLADLVLYLSKYFIFKYFVHLYLFADLKINIPGVFFATKSVKMLSSHLGMKLFAYFSLKCFVWILWRIKVFMWLAVD